MLTIISAIDVEPWGIIPDVNIESNFLISFC